MGWTGLRREKGIKDIDFFRQEFNDPDGEKVLDAARNGSTVYLAYRSPVEGNPVVGVTILTQLAPKSYYNFTYKEMDETSGPVEAKCPERILDQLTPLAPCEKVHDEGDYCGDCSAIQWRRRCRKYHVERKARPKVKKGQTIVFAQPIGGETRYVLEDARRNTLRAERTGARYHVSWWRKVKYEVEAAA